MVCTGGITLVSLLVYVKAINSGLEVSRWEIARGVSHVFQEGFSAGDILPFPMSAVESLSDV